MLCKSQESTDEPCEGGLSRRIRCLIGMGNDCMKHCNSESCPAFELLEEAESSSAQSVGRVSAVGADGASSQGSCGGCGAIKELPSENKFI